MENLVHITFMRHGRSRADDEEVHEGRYDSPLTDVGRQQIARRAEQWKQEGVQFDLIVCSTLVRAHESAQIIQASVGGPLELDSDWMEIDNGPLAGLPFEEAETRYPRSEFHTPYQPHVASVGEGESLWDLRARAVRALQKVVLKGPGRYLIVAHGAVLNEVLRSIVGAPPLVNDSGMVFRFGDGGYAQFSYYAGDHSWLMTEFR